jgi:hypothetical protein
MKLRFYTTVDFSHGLKCLFIAIESKKYSKSIQLNWDEFANIRCTQQDEWPINYFCV